jgi:hypothetical protein
MAVWDDKVWINTSYHKDIAESLRPGQVVVLFDEEMEVQTVLEFDEEHGVWLGTPDWSTRGDLGST